MCAGDVLVGCDVSDKWRVEGIVRWTGGRVGACVRGYGIAFCGAMYGCSLMYLSLDPALCDTTVDECDC